jgi:hypothetical protein
VKRTVALRGGPLDGQLYEVDERQLIAYIVHQTKSVDELTRFGFTSTGGELPIVLLVYKQIGRDSPVWRFLGVNDQP